MANYALQITHLCIGLGLSVLIELENGGSKCFLGLLDCGSVTGESGFWDKALEQIITAVDNRGGCIDYLHISHFDKDHYNKLENLAGLYMEKHKDKPAAKIKVKKVIFGCLGQKNQAEIKGKMKSYFDVADANLYVFVADQFAPVRNIYCCPQASAWSSCLYENILLDTNLYFRICPILYHAHLMPKEFHLDISLGGSGVMINTGSSILLVTIVADDGTNAVPYVSYVFTGDATLQTMQIMKSRGFQFGSENKLVLVPHHGAKRHMADDEDTSNFDTLKGVLKTIGPASAVVSAKCTNRRGWTHPNADTIAVYLPYLQKPPSFSQRLTGFIWDKAKDAMKVKQGTADCMFYETFRLDQTKVKDEVLYHTCDAGSYEKIDVRMTSTYQDPRNFTMSEHIR